MSEPSKLKRNDSHVPEKWSLIFSEQDDIAPNSCEGVHVVNVCCVCREAYQTAVKGCML